MDITMRLLRTAIPLSFGTCDCGHPTVYNLAAKVLAHFHHPSGCGCVDPGVVIDGQVHAVLTDFGWGDERDRDALRTMLTEARDDPKAKIDRYRQDGMRLATEILTPDELALVKRAILEGPAIAAAGLEALGETRRAVEALDGSTLAHLSRLARLLVFACEAETIRRSAEPSRGPGEASRDTSASTR